MRLEDALLYVVLDSEPGQAGGVAEGCAEAIAGGADIIQITVGRDAPGPLPVEDARRVAEVCRRDDALLIIRGDASAAVALGADGVHLDDPAMSVSLARAEGGPERLVGVSSISVDELRLAFAVGVDYVIHMGGTGCPAAFSGLHGEATAPLFAGGLESVEEAGQLVGQGICRFCVDWKLVAGAETRERAAEFSRLLGRCI